MHSVFILSLLTSFFIHNFIYFFYKFDLILYCCCLWCCCCLLWLQIGRHDYICIIQSLCVFFVCLWCCSNCRIYFLKCNLHMSHMQVKLYNDDGHTNTYNLNCYSFSAFTLSLSLFHTIIFPTLSCVFVWSCRWFFYETGSGYVKQLVTFI